MIRPGEAMRFHAEPRGVTQRVLAVAGGRVPCGARDVPLRLCGHSIGFSWIRRPWSTVGSSRAAAGSGGPLLVYRLKTAVALTGSLPSRVRVARTL